MNDVAIRRYVCDRISEALSLAGMTQGELGARLGIGGNAVSQMIKGTRGVSVERLVQIAEATEREVSFFLPGPGKPDLAAALRAAFPGMTDGQVLGVEAYARFLMSPESRVGGAGSGRPDGR